MSQPMAKKDIRNGILSQSAVTDIAARHITVMQSGMFDCLVVCQHLQLNGAYSRRAHHDTISNEHHCNRPTLALSQGQKAYDTLTFLA